MSMDSIEFSVARIHQMWDGQATPEFLAEIAFLYDHYVKTGTQEPIIDMGMKLMIPFAQVGEMVSYAMEDGVHGFNVGRGCDKGKYPLTLNQRNLRTTNITKPTITRKNPTGRVKNINQMYPPVPLPSSHIEPP